MRDGQPLSGEGEDPKKGADFLQRTQKDSFGDVSSMGRETEIASEDVCTGEVFLALCTEGREKY